MTPTTEVWQQCLGGILLSGDSATVSLVWCISFLFFNFQKVKTKIIVVVVLVEKQLSTGNFIDISYHSFIRLHFTTHIKATCITETVKVQQTASISII